MQQTMERMSTPKMMRRWTPNERDAQRQQCTPLRLRIDRAAAVTMATPINTVPRACNVSRRIDICFFIRSD